MRTEEEENRYGAKIKNLVCEWCGNKEFTLDIKDLPPSFGASCKCGYGLTFNYQKEYDKYVIAEKIK